MSILLASALEAVKFQVEPVLFETVTKNIKKMRAEDEYTATSPAAKELSDVVKRFTNISLTVSYENSSEVNASVYLPDLDRNHPIINSTRRAYLNNRDALVILRKKNLAIVEGSVDLEKGKVFGVFEELDCMINLTTGLMNDTGMTNEEVAAIFLHELGHLMSYCEYIYRSVSSNYALLAVADAITTADTKKRIELIDATSKHFDFPEESLEPLKTTSSKDVAISVLLTQNIRKTRSELGANVYDRRGCEHLADQYAARMGAGPALTTGLAKMHRRSPSTYSTAGFVAFEGLKLTLLALSMYAISPLVLVLLVVAYDPTDKIYDDPEARLRRIRNELIGGMKNKDISKLRREQLKKDLEIIDESISNFKDRRSFYELLYTSFLPSGRDQHKRMVHQQELEALANNELFSKAMNFTLI